ncbi:hypothetical protein FNO01nite_17740 [Flavobacterium noncentrifugens]|uniref:MutS domain V n=1 Tax=Flavobacterium noncentrifugens TaxID=1128970 RepID=A0A1G8WZ04_9FLAO|nr:DNA mismatch repair protein [Flavobacterium noncentrifugens]GEP51102.1 hypothetical protein FNO01nite_17740 [Flavobacterium noncentrifugens]SDJ83612.1 MutS domain V [Flavobacterium noncentrifugens]
MTIYQQRKEAFSDQLESITKNYNAISIARLITVLLLLAFLFFGIKRNENLWFVGAAILFVVFVFLMRKHSELSYQKKLKQALVKINSDEIDYLERKSLPFENGSQHQDFSHLYAYDLDIFGEHSLFQNLNRTTTFIGQKILANQLLTLLSNEQILQNQAAIQELSGKLEWRHELMALGKISHDNKEQYENLLRWSRSGNSPLSKFQVFLSFLSPILLIGSFAGYLITDDSFLIKITSFLFAFNLFLLGLCTKRIKSEIQHAEGIDKIINQYSEIVKNIETENFLSEKANVLKQQLFVENHSASAHLKKLSGLFSNMDSIANLFSTVLFNGIFLFHVHVLKALLHWRKNHSAQLEKWLDTIGEFEMLSSLANLAYNNPDFAFPNLNDQHTIDFKNLSHPLLNKETRAGNDVKFNPQFMILTGSNMSGKSTFLRSLGINMVLTGIGSAVCADEANVHPLPVLVSMRLSDSLADSESYFYAEIKRLKQIMDGLENKRAFVLLDEILRGTNSDDKRSGTIGVVKKMIEKQAIGAIATHDIEVCQMTNEFPGSLANKCFEVEIINNDLHFDYKLRNGICQNKSATFLMTKTGII